ncbi:hypothetical protein Tco_0498143 [Tanacetum coccineum]
MKDPMYVEKKVKIAPPDYSKENYLATFTPQKQLTPEQIFWSDDILKEKAKKSVTSSNAPTFDLVFVIGNLKEKLQGRGNTIQELKETISQLKKKHSEADPIVDFKALDS